MIQKLLFGFGIFMCGGITLAGFIAGGDPSDLIITLIFLSLTVLLIWKWPGRKTKVKSKPKAKTKPKSKPRPAASRSTGPADELAYIDSMDGHAFEHFVADLLRKLGYERVEVTPDSGDQGVDILARKGDKRYAIQCKRYSKKLGNTPVQEVYAGKTVYGCNVAIVVTNNYFTAGAKEAARSTGVLLWDRDELKQMIRFSNWKNL